MTKPEIDQLRRNAQEIPYKYFTYETDTREFKGDGIVIARFSENPLAEKVGMKLAAISKPIMLQVIDEIDLQKRFADEFKTMAYNLRVENTDLKERLAKISGEASK